MSWEGDGDVHTHGALKVKTQELVQRTVVLKQRLWEREPVTGRESEKKSSEVRGWRVGASREIDPEIGPNAINDEGRWTDVHKEGQ